MSGFNGWDALSWAKRQRVGNTGAKALLIALASFADEQMSCYPGQELLAEITEQSERSVRRHLCDLEERGFIQREARYREHGGRTSDRYFLQVQGGWQNDAGHSVQTPIPNRPDLPVCETTIPANHDTHTGQPEQTIPATVAGELPVELPGEQPEEITTPEIEIIDECFDLCWAVYPRKTAKIGARRAFGARIRAGVSAAALLQATTRFAEEMKGREKQYVMFPTTFFGPDQHWKEFLDEEAIKERTGRTETIFAKTIRELREAK